MQLSITFIHFIDDLSWILFFLFFVLIYFFISIYFLCGYLFNYFCFSIYLRVVLCIHWYSSRYHMAQNYSTGIKKYDEHMLDTWFAYSGFFRRRRFRPSPLHRHLFTFGVKIWYPRFIDCNNSIEKHPPFSYKQTQELFGFLNPLYFFMIFQ